ncbi:ParM/StbA family protein [Compostibacter hankyongensis]|uniref:Actin-like protein N-terminal domain-containing protein n=1 Tax=Compostibacter hankyongensis TaxID=1007089 RepID=A0ABP8FXU7_9BACT
MNIYSLTLPSVFETSFGNTESSAKDLLNGLKIKKDNAWYMVGNLAKTGGTNPHHITNAAPGEEDYDIFFSAALVSVLEKIQQPLTITVGFPFSTYNVYKAEAEKLLGRRHLMIEYDTQTFNTGGGVKKGLFEIDNFEVIPELVASIIGLKKLLNEQAPSNFMVISLGFGTVEGGMATESGLIHRTCFSSHGLQYVVDNLNRELGKKYYLEMKNAHQLDDALMKGSIFINRKKIDLKTLRKELLEQYYREVITPLLRKYFTDQDFEQCEKIYLVGGGTFYPELTEAFMKAFAEAIPVEIAPQAEKLASIGYLYNSYKLSNRSAPRSLGIDIGNSTTIVSLFQENSSQPNAEESV